MIYSYLALHEKVRIMKPNILNLDQLTYSKHSHGERFEAEIAPVANLMNAEKLGFRITKLPPGKRAWPLHAHYVNEEMFFVLQGEGRVQFGEESYPIRTGDFISAPANPDLPHQIINTSNKELMYLCVSTMLEPEIAVYPDSGKIGVIAGDAPGRLNETTRLVKFIKAGKETDYWDGE